MAPSLCAAAILAIHAPLDMSSCFAPAACARVVQTVNRHDTLNPRASKDRSEWGRHPAVQDQYVLCPESHHRCSSVIFGPDKDGGNCASGALIEKRRICQSSSLCLMGHSKSVVAPCNNCRVHWRVFSDPSAPTPPQQNTSVKSIVAGKTST